MRWSGRFVNGCWSHPEPADERPAQEGRTPRQRRTQPHVWADHRHILPPGSRGRARWTILGGLALVAFLGLTLGGDLGPGAATTHP